MNYDLPKKLNIGGKDYDIYSDYRDILDIISMMKDPELHERDKQALIIAMFYPDWENIPQRDLKEAIEKCIWFINGGESETGAKGPRLMDWEQEFKIIVAPINRVLGKEIREMKYLHWWSLLSSYMEIGDCLFAQVVRVRERKSKGKMDKADREFYRKNRKLVDFTTTYTDAENDILKDWT